MKFLNDLVNTVEVTSSASTDQAKKGSAHNVITGIISEKFYSTLVPHQADLPFNVSMPFSIYQQAFCGKALC